MKVLFIGDIIGKSGRRAIKALVPTLINRHNVDVVIANGENAAGGFGITPTVSDELFDLGVNLITTGNHVWDKKDIFPYLDSGKPILRPGNYPPGNPGRGMRTFETFSGEKLSVINVSGRVFMDSIDCPFRYVESELDPAKKESSAVFIDFHAEATSEKNALAKYFDGEVSCIVGTHTHVQTSDEKVTPLGTGYITDAGMTGATDSIIGMQPEGPLVRFLNGIPKKFEVAKKAVELQGVLADIDGISGRCNSIERIKEVLK